MAKRRMEFKMERTGLLREGEVLPVTEGSCRILIIIRLAMRMRCQRIIRFVSG